MCEERRALGASEINQVHLTWLTTYSLHSPPQSSALKVPQTNSIRKNFTRSLTKGDERHLEEILPEAHKVSVQLHCEKENSINREAEGKIRVLYMYQYLSTFAQRRVRDYAFK